MTTDLQSAPFGRSGIPPYEILLHGAGGRIRTPDLLITNQLLYQLSYTSTRPCNNVKNYSINIRDCQEVLRKKLKKFLFSFAPRFPTRFEAKAQALDEKTGKNSEKTQFA